MHSPDLTQLNSLSPNDLKKEIGSQNQEGRKECLKDQQVVSFYAELPSDLQLAMRSFIERYPNWDQYRLIKAALAGFLVQNGCNSRQITRLYVGNMFRSESMVEGV